MSDTETAIRPGLPRNGVETIKLTLACAVTGVVLSYQHV
jgi:hypothetical protein